MGTVLSLNISSERGTEKQAVPMVHALEGWGLEGDAHGGDWDRQICVFPIEAMEKVPPEKRDEVFAGGLTENITISGIAPERMLVGTLLQIGEAVIEIFHVGKDEYKEAGRPYIVSREGRFGKIIQGGIIQTGDSVDILTDRMAMNNKMRM